MAKAKRYRLIYLGSNQELLYRMLEQDNNEMIYLCDHSIHYPSPEMLEVLKKFTPNVCHLVILPHTPNSEFSIKISENIPSDLIPISVVVHSNIGFTGKHKLKYESAGINAFFENMDFFRQYALLLSKMYV